MSGKSQFLLQLLIKEEKEISKLLSLSLEEVHDEEEEDEEAASPSLDGEPIPQIFRFQNHAWASPPSRPPWERRSFTPEEPERPRYSPEEPERPRFQKTRDSPEEPERSSDPPAKKSGICLCL